MRPRTFSFSLTTAPGFRTGRSALFGGWDAHRATGDALAPDYREPASRLPPPHTSAPTA